MQEPLGLEYLWHWFVQLLELKVHYREIEVCHISSWYRGIMNQIRRFIKIDRTFWLHELESSWSSLKPLWNWVCTSMTSSYQRRNLTPIAIGFFDYSPQCIVQTQHMLNKLLHPTWMSNPIHGRPPHQPGWLGPDWMGQCGRCIMSHHLRLSM